LTIGDRLVRGQSSCFPIDFAETDRPCKKFTLPCWPVINSEVISQIFVLVMKYTVHCRKRKTGVRPTTTTVTWHRNSAVNTDLYLDHLLLLRLLPAVQKMLQQMWVLHLLT